MKTEKEKILRSVLGGCYANGQESLYACPKCDHRKKKLSVNLEKNVFKCWICDYSGTDITSLVSYYGRPYLKEWSLLTKPDFSSSSFDVAEMFSPVVQVTTEITLPESFELVANPGFNHYHAVSYLKGRGISSTDMLKWKVGFCRTGPYAGRVVVPSFSATGVLNYFIARSIDRKVWPKYKNPPASKDVIFNELIIDWRKPVTLVEGVFDAMRVENSIPLLGSTLRHDTAIVNKLAYHGSKVTIALDGDAYNKALGVYKLLSQFDLDVKFLKIKGQRDLGDMRKQEVQELFNTVTDINQDNYLLYEINKIL